MAGFRLAITQNSESCLTKTNANWYRYVSFRLNNILSHPIFNIRELPENIAADMAWSETWVWPSPTCGMIVISFSCFYSYALNSLKNVAMSSLLEQSFSITAETVMIIRWTIFNNRKCELTRLRVFNDLLESEFESESHDAGIGIRIGIKFFGIHWIRNQCRNHGFW